MEIIKWIEPSISKRVIHVTESCNTETQSIDNEFRRVFNDLVKRYPGISDELIELNDMFFNRHVLIDTAYRMGFMDARYITYQFTHAPPTPREIYNEL